MFKLIVTNKTTKIYSSYKYPSLDEITSHVNKLDLNIYQIRIETIS
jgi:hypothetical protein